MPFGPGGAAMEGARALTWNVQRSESLFCLALLVDYYLILAFRCCGQSRVMHEVANRIPFLLSQTEYEQASHDAPLAERSTTYLDCITAVDLKPPSHVACPATTTVRRTRGQDEDAYSGVDRRQGPVESQDQSLGRQQGSECHRKHNRGTAPATRSCRGKSGNASKTSVGASYIFQRKHFLAAPPAFAPTRKMAVQGGTHINCDAT